jgi:hypothetical protein
LARVVLRDVDGPTDHRRSIHTFSVLGEGFLGAGCLKLFIFEGCVAQTILDGTGE